MSNATVKEPAFNLVDVAQIRYKRKSKWDEQLAAIREGLNSLHELKFPTGKAASYDFTNVKDQKSFGNAVRIALKSWNMSERFKVNLSQDGKVVWIRNR